MCPRRVGTRTIDSSVPVPRRNAGRPPLVSLIRSRPGTDIHVPVRVLRKTGMRPCADDGGMYTYRPAVARRPPSDERTSVGITTGHRCCRANGFARRTRSATRCAYAVLPSYRRPSPLTRRFAGVHGSRDGTVRFGGARTPGPVDAFEFARQGSIVFFIISLSFVAYFTRAYVSS